MAAASRKQHLLGKRQSLSTEEVLAACQKTKLVQKVMTFMISKCEKICSFYTLLGSKEEAQDLSFCRGEGGARLGGSL